MIKGDTIMTIINLLNYINMILAFIAVLIYVVNAIKCSSKVLRTWKYLTAFNFFIVALLYFMFIVEYAVDPLVIKLNTTLIIVLVICNGILGRMKHGRKR